MLVETQTEVHPLKSTVCQRALLFDTLLNPDTLTCIHTRKKYY